MRIVSEILRHPANRDSKYTALLRSTYWQIYKRLTGKPLDITFHGLKLRCFPENRSTSRAIYFSGLPDFREMRFMIDDLRPEDRFIDVGANAGIYTLLACSIVGEKGSVQAIEPNPDAATLLIKNLKLNRLKNVSVHGIALSDMSTNVSFNSTDDTCNSYVGVAGETPVSENLIQAERMDEYLPEFQYAMAKLDVEGYEPFIIRGASKWLRSDNPPVMQIETAGYSNRYGISTSALIEELKCLGYFTAVYDPETRSLQPTCRPWEVPADNILAVSMSRRSFVEQRLSSNNPLDQDR